MYDDQDTLNFEEECRKHEFRRSIERNERQRLDDKQTDIEQD